MLMATLVPEAIEERAMAAEEVTAGATGAINEVWMATKGVISLLSVILELGAESRAEDCGPADDVVTEKVVRSQGAGASKVSS